MVDLSHWDFAEYFSGHEAAALMLGLEPTTVSEDQKRRVKVVVDRMRLHYQNAIDIRPWDFPGGILENQVGNGTDCNLIILISFDMEELHQVYSLQGADAPRFEVEWFSNPGLVRFESQRFSRKQISNWLGVIGMVSLYPFERSGVKLGATHTDQSEVDPSDMPLELDIANIAYRAVTNGYGDPMATPRSRLVAYVKEHFVELKPDTVKRIATIANPDKSVGRKNYGKE